MTTTMPIPESDALLRVGDAMPDGSIYAGASPDTGRPMYTTPKDAPLTLTFDEAVRYASKLDTYGHNDWRVPTKAELNVLFQNRAAIGGFDTTGLFPASWHWSSSRGDDNHAWAQRFSDGSQYYLYRNRPPALRCVRG